MFESEKIVTLGSPAGPVVNPTSAKAVRAEAWSGAPPTSTETLYQVSIALLRGGGFEARSGWERVGNRPMRLIVQRGAAEAMVATAETTWPRAARVSVQSTATPLHESALEVVVGKRGLPHIVGYDVALRFVVSSRWAEMVRALPLGRFSETELLLSTEALPQGHTALLPAGPGKFHLGD